MKYALILAAFGLVLWIWLSQRQSRQNELDERAKKSSSATPPVLGQATEIVACAVCNLHLPLEDALKGKKGLYCSKAHQQLAGD